MARFFRHREGHVTRSVTATLSRSDRFGIEQRDGEVVDGSFAEASEGEGDGQLARLWHGAVQRELAPALRQADAVAQLRTAERIEHQQAIVRGGQTPRDIHPAMNAHELALADGNGA